MPDGPPAATHTILGETSRFAALQTAGAVLGWGAQVALARLLGQRDFGVYGICSFYIGLGQLLGDGGLGATLLRRQDEPSSEEYRAAVTSLLAVAALFAVALAVGAPFIARNNHFTHAEQLALYAMAPLYFLGAFRMAPYVRLERELRFSVIARVELTANVAKHAIALIVAALHGGLWALIAAQLTGASLQLMGAFRASPGWVGIGFSWRAWKPLMAYGSRVQASTLAAYLKDNLSRALLGTLLGPAAVGVYDFGMGYIQVPVVAVNALARVQLPIYARLTQRDPALAAAVRGALRSAALLGLPLLGVLAWGAPQFIDTIYGAKWVAAYPVVWGLLVNMICSLALSPLFTLMQGQGCAGAALIVFGCWTSATWLLSLAAWRVAGAQPLAAVAIATSLASLGTIAYLLRWASRHLQQNLLAALWRLLAAFALALGAAALCHAHGAPPLAAGLVFLIGYIACVAAFERELIARELQSVLRALRRAT